MLTILAKDLRLRLRDRSALVLGVVAPLTLAFILSRVVGDFGGEDFSARFGVVDEDGAQVGETFSTVLRQAGDAVEVETGLTEAEARRRLDDGDLDAAFVIPAGMTASVLGEEPEEIRVIGDVNARISTDVARSIAQGFAASLDAGRLSLAVSRDGGVDPAVDPEVADPAVDPEVVAEAFEQRPPVGVALAATDDRELDATTYLMAGLGVLFLFFLVQYGVLGLLEESREGTLARLLAAPVPPLAIPLAKALTSVVMGVGGLTTIAVVSTLALGADWGDPLAVAVLVVAVVLAAVSVVGVVAGVARTPEQAGNAQAIIALVLGLLGGSFFPVSQGEGILTRLAVITPHHWFLRGLGEASSGGLADAVGPVVALLGFAVVVGAVGVVMLGRGSWRTT